jgi:hypothetical protein
MLRSMPEPTEATKACLEYLDKEMTIMGILSTFCFAAAALVIDRAASADKTSFFKDVLTHHPNGCRTVLLSATLSPRTLLRFDMYQPRRSLRNRMEHSSMARRVLYVGDMDTLSDRLSLPLLHCNRLLQRHPARDLSEATVPLEN